VLEGEVIMFRKLKAAWNVFLDKRDINYYSDMVLYWEKELKQAEKRKVFCNKALHQYRYRLYKAKGGV
jgi:hypothetical protein